MVLVFKLLSLVRDGEKDIPGSLNKTLGSLQLTGEFSVGIKSFEAKDKMLSVAFQAVVTIHTSIHDY